MENPLNKNLEDHAELQPLEEPHALCIILDITASMGPYVSVTLDLIRQYVMMATATQNLEQLGLVLVDDHYSRSPEVGAYRHPDNTKRHIPSSSPWLNNTSQDRLQKGVDITPAVWFADRTENLEEFVFWVFRHALDSGNNMRGVGGDTPECYDCGVDAAHRLFADYPNPVNYWLVADSYPHAQTCPFAPLSTSWEDVALLHFSIPPFPRELKGYVQFEFDLHTRPITSIRWLQDDEKDLLSYCCDAPVRRYFGFFECQKCLKAGAQSYWQRR